MTERPGGSLFPLADVPVCWKGCACRASAWSFLGQSDAGGGEVRESPRKTARRARKGVVRRGVRRERGNESSRSEVLGVPK